MTIQDCWHSLDTSLICLVYELREVTLHLTRQLSWNIRLILDYSEQLSDIITFFIIDPQTAIMNGTRNSCWNRKYRQRETKTLTHLTTQLDSLNSEIGFTKELDIRRFFKD